MLKIKDIVHFLEGWAPPAYQEGYDNAGLLTGNRQDIVQGVMLCLDATEAVLDEAIEKNCNLIVAHHPIIFKGLKSITGKNYVERVVLKAIRNNLAIYAIHTNLDHVHTGVNRKIGERLGLQKMQILSPKKQLLNKLTVFVPQENTQAVADALHKAGAGEIGNYSHCSFRSSGTGTFLPGDAANPTLGERGKLEEASEDRLEVIFPSFKAGAILSAMKEAHPYEEVAYFLQGLENENQEVGAGMLGELAEPMEGMEFLQLLKKQLPTGCVRYTKLPERKIKKVAVCGGAGIFLLRTALAKGADAFVTADVKYHEFFDADEKLLLADIGHYESEVFTKDLLYEHLNQKFPNIALYLTRVSTNPISYL